MMRGEIEQDNSEMQLASKLTDIHLLSQVYLNLIRLIELNPMNAIYHFLMYIDLLS